MYLSRQTLFTLCYLPASAVGYYPMYTTKVRQFTLGYYHTRLLGIQNVYQTLARFLYVCSFSLNICPSSTLRSGGTLRTCTEKLPIAAKESNMKLYLDKPKLLPITRSAKDRRRPFMDLSATVLSSPGVFMAFISAPFDSSALSQISLENQ